MNEKQQLLEELKKEMEANGSLPLADISNFVFGEGNPDSEVCFIGEAPGFHENQQKRPFVGLAGKLLDKLLGEINWPRESVYITNIVKRRPPENRDPLPEEIASYAPYLKRQIEILEPNIIATLGRFSMNYFLPDAKISRDRGRLFRANSYFIYPLYHPAAALRSTNVLEELRKDFRRLPHAVERAKNGGVIKEEIQVQSKPEEDQNKQSSLF
ncbi:MAG: DNA polymerase bacteriophage-type [Parcubacteria group bacterium Gr01-1014_70]|nr:MAG: DNA polymerase bacteriophage-type [Parcubacteria group bacterium Gr01-1014_70]